MSKTTDYIIEEKNQEFDMFNEVRKIIELIKQHKGGYKAQIKNTTNTIDRLELEAKVEALNTVVLEWIKS